MALSEFCGTYNLQNLKRSHILQKSFQPTCIYKPTINFPKSFQHTQIKETGLSDFLKLVLTILKTHFLRLKPNIVNYRDYKDFVNDYFRSELLQKKLTAQAQVSRF